MQLKAFVEHKLFNGTILALILINAVIIGLETYPAIFTQYETLFNVLNNTLLFIFTIEIILKTTVYKGDFFKNPWNVMDFLIVALSLIFINSSFVSLLRILRVLRVLRTISAFPSLRRVVSALFLSVPAMISSLFLMIILFYIYGIMGTILFAQVSPMYFGELQLSLLTLFQVFTLEAWASEVFRPIFDVYGWSWLYFSTFIIFSAFIIANIFFGELVTNAQKLAQMSDSEDNITEDLSNVQIQLKTLQEQNETLHKQLNHLTTLLQREETKI